VKLDHGAEPAVGPFHSHRVMTAPVAAASISAMHGNATRFTRQDGVEDAWKVMQPLLDARPPVNPYEKGSWGPGEADQLLAGQGRWHDAWVGS
jgi:glucose-6-phosphate 1-dehydrogenase